jgi:tetratricopeptide (TPR) repeat protein
LLEGLAEVKDNILEAQAGQMRTAYKLGHYDDAATAADKVLANASDKDLQNEAHLIKGRAAMTKEDLKTAKTEFQLVAQRTNSEMTAEANYELAFIEYKLTNYKESKDLIFKIQKQNPSYDYWIAKGFILLGDNYIAQKDTFQAKETYKSVVENYNKNPDDPEDLKQIAQTKLDQLLVAEKPKAMETPKAPEMPVDSTKEMK